MSLSYGMAAICEHVNVDLPRSPRSPEVTIFETADEIAYAESTGGVFVAIGSVVPEL